jgi:hypothetical protein
MNDQPFTAAKGRGVPYQELYSFEWEMKLKTNNHRWLGLTQGTAGGRQEKSGEFFSL